MTQPSPFHFGALRGGAKTRRRKGEGDQSGPVRRPVQNMRRLLRIEPCKCTARCSQRHRVNGGGASRRSQWHTINEGVASPGRPSGRPDSQRQETSGQSISSTLPPVGGSGQERLNDSGGVASPGRPSGRPDSQRQETSGQSISRILSSGSLRLCSHLSGRRVTAPFVRPTRGWPPPLKGKARGETSSLPSSTDDSPLLGLAPGGGYLAARITADAGGPLHHLFTITLPSEDGGAVCFCGPFRQVNASRRFPRPGYSPTPCSLECGLSSTP